MNNKPTKQQPIDFSKSPQENKNRFLSRGNIHELYALSDKKRKQVLDKSLCSEQKEQTLKELKEYADRIEEQARLIEERLKRQINLQSEIFNPQALKVMQDAQNRAREIAEQFAPVFADMQKRVREHIHYIQDTKPKALRACKEYNWTISPHAPAYFIDKIASLTKQEKESKAMDKLFIDFFERENWKIMGYFAQEWEKTPYFKDRIAIIKDCIGVLQSSDNQKVNVVNVILPTLIVQIEGIWVDFLRMKNPDQLINRRTGYDNKKTRFEQATEYITDDFDKLARSQLLEGLFGSNFRNQGFQEILGFNRHEIIHAYNTGYGRKDYLIKTFLLIDFLTLLE